VHAAGFTDEWKLAHYEEGESQTFQNEFVEILGVTRRRVASFGGNLEAKSIKYCLERSFNMVVEEGNRKNESTGDKGPPRSSNADLVSNVPESGKRDLPQDEKGSNTGSDDQIDDNGALCL
jgi:hypothetical protein